MLEWLIGLLGIGKNRRVLHLVEPGFTWLWSWDWKWGMSRHYSYCHWDFVRRATWFGPRRIELQCRRLRIRTRHLSRLCCYGSHLRNPRVPSHAMWTDRSKYIACSFLLLSFVNWLVLLPRCMLATRKQRQRMCWGRKKRRGDPDWP